ncbi:MAG: RNA-binding S4 domain-containing protein [Desulforhopalus sp.]
MSAQNKKIPVKNLPIRLGQFLKLANIVQDGFEAKIRIQNGEVMVNSIVETRRGRQLKNLDEVTVDRVSWVVDIV